MATETAKMTGRLPIIMLPMLLKKVAMATMTGLPRKGIACVKVALVRIADKPRSRPPRGITAIPVVRLGPRAQWLGLSGWMAAFLAHQPHSGCFPWEFLFPRAWTLPSERRSLRSSPHLLFLRSN